jgi:hypothetical protein
VLGTVYTADNTAPVISMPNPTAGNSKANVSGVTYEDNGALYWLVTLASEVVPDAAEVKVGTRGASTVSGAHRYDSAVVVQTFTPLPPGRATPSCPPWADPQPPM